VNQVSHHVKIIDVDVYPDIYLIQQVISVCQLVKFSSVVLKHIIIWSLYFKKGIYVHLTMAVQEFCCQMTRKRVMFLWILTLIHEVQ